jgi:hypothetical protein
MVGRSSTSVTGAGVVGRGSFFSGSVDLAVIGLGCTRAEGL